MHSPGLPHPRPGPQAQLTEGGKTPPRHQFLGCPVQEGPSWDHSQVCRRPQHLGICCKYTFVSGPRTDLLGQKLRAGPRGLLSYSGLRSALLHFPHSLPSGGSPAAGPPVAGPPPTLMPRAWAPLHPDPWCLEQSKL